MSSLMFLSSFRFYTVALFFLFFSSTTIAISTNVTDHEALLQFKAKITDDPLGFMSSWNHTTHFCQWYGVNCSKLHNQRVTSLSLPSLKLSGSISPYIGNLSFLKILRLKDNSFNHEIPPQIGRLRRLKILSLYNNSFSGKIPVNLSSCSNLITIYLDDNQLEGQVPAEFGSLIRLEYIDIGKNHLTGNIPSSLGNLSSLDELFLPYNHLSGSIPHTLGQLKTVSILALTENKLSGTIPLSVLNISSITKFDVGFNQLHGSLPMELGTMLSNLQFFSVSMNQFTGPFPISLSNTSNLETIVLVRNNFSGKVPSLEKLHGLKHLSLTSNHLGSRGRENDLSFLCTLTNATTLDVLGVNGNNFGGKLPECVGNLSSKLKVLLLDGNYIFGSIPTGIERLIHLTILDMTYNQLSGNIPASIGRLKNLEFLSFSKNKFSGHIPSSLGNLTQLIGLHLSRNNLQGSIPLSLGNCQNLLELDLSNNNLTDVIPPAIFKLSSLSIALDLHQNHLTGSLPIEIQYLKHVGILDVSENNLSGEIPTSLGSCTSLEFLSIKGNYFQGTIPSSFSSLRGLQVLDLSRNNFSGKIPQFLTHLIALSSLNLSYNNFKGMLPTRGIFKNATATSVIGNSNLCGGMPEFHLPVCNLKKYRRRKLTRKQTLIISIICGLFGVTSFLVFLVFLRFKKKRKETTTRDLEVSMLKISYHDLLKATDGFSSANLIGKGSFGSVYKGVLDQDNMVIAVKVFNLSHKGASKSFIAECEALRNIRHRNLVKVLTACSSIDHHGNDFKALVYEFMVNKSLEEWLHPPVIINEANEACRNLGLLQRLNIAIDVACALEYLHHHCKTQIVHCDLKPSNVLLDNDMVAHVGDFGLAKFFFDGTPNYSTNQSSSIGLRGTVGYAPPEYGMGSEISIYGDIYSFGILLLEIFTRKRPTDDNFKDGLNLRNYIMLALPNQITEIADPIILQMKIEEHTYRSNIRNQRRSTNEKILDSLSSIFEIGISCSAEMPKDRIDVKKAIIKLCSIRDNFKPR